MAQDVDLWGDPVPPRVEKRGRPKHEKSAEKSMRVAVLVAAKHSEDRIAAALGIDPKTLRKYYSGELKQGLAQKRAELITLTWEKVKAGNVSAMRLMHQLLREADLDTPDLPKPATPVERPVKLGKKELADLEAQQPDTTTTMGELIATRRAVMH